METDPQHCPADVHTLRVTHKRALSLIRLPIGVKSIMWTGAAI
jgi:hypothetical protein